jgi:hypothetical protein
MWVPARDDRFVDEFRIYRTHLAFVRTGGDKALTKFLSFAAFANLSS